jgi:flagellar hook assembly protein FlgD
MQLHFTNGTTLSCNISTIVNFRYTQSTGVDEPAFAPTALAVSPNPAHELFTVSYQFTASGPVSLEIFDITGNLVYSEPQGEKASGYYTCKWKPTVNGIYLVKLRTARNTICKTILAQ